jgi:pimeloyl-ACP methyl ester carboxylesterase
VIPSQRIEVGGVPALVHEPAGARGLLLLGHGGGHGKDAPRFVELARRCALGTGLAVVCIDAVDHGERRPTGDVGPDLPPGWHSMAIPRMVADWQAVVATLAERLGPPRAYVGVSMGSIFGVPVAAALPTIAATVLLVGGIPEGPWLDDPALAPRLLEGAAGLAHTELLMVNRTDDALFPIDGVHRLFGAVPGPRKRLVFLPGAHDDWSDELVDGAVEFVTRFAGAA